MRRVSFLLPVLLSLFLQTALAWQGPRPKTEPTAGPVAPPKAEVNEVKETIQGVEISDPYRWLEDQSSAQTRAWIDAENAYTDSLLNHVPGREALKQQLTSLLKVNAMGAPRVRNGRYFFSKRQADQDQFLLYMRKGLDGPDELLIDPLALSPQHTITVAMQDVSLDGSLLVYALRQGGED